MTTDKEQNPRPPELSPTSVPPSGGATVGCYHFSSQPTYTASTTHGPDALPTYRPSVATKTEARPRPADTGSDGTAGLDLDDLIASCRLPIPSIDTTSHQPYLGDFSMLHDRLAVESFAGRDLLRRMRARWGFYRDHMTELEADRRNAVAVRRDWRNPLDDRPYLGDPDLLRDLQRIDGERRAERLSLWRDLNDLRSKLPDQWMSYVQSYRRSQLLSSPSDLEEPAPGTGVNAIGGAPQDIYPASLPQQASRAGSDENARDTSGGGTSGVTSGGGVGGWDA